MGYNPTIPHLQIGYNNPFTNHLLTSWDIQVNNQILIDGNGDFQLFFP